MEVWPQTPPEGGGMSELFDASPEVNVHTSAAAEAALLLGVASVLAAPFSLMFAVSLGLAVPGLLCALAGVAMTSRRDVSGNALAPIGLICSLVTLALLGLRYLGLDTAVGDQFATDLRAGLDFVNGLLPPP